MDRPQVTESKDEQTSESLMLAYAAGDADAFAILYGLHKAPLFRFLLRQGIAASRADELFQEIWLKIIKARDNYQSTARFQTWLYTIARNHLIDDFRKNGKAEITELLDEHVADVSSATSGESIDNDRNKEKLLASVSALPFEQRQAFLLKHEAGLNNADIAEITETNQETVKSRIRYAMNQLKKQLGGSP